MVISGASIITIRVIKHYIGNSFSVIIKGSDFVASARINSRIKVDSENRSLSLQLGNCYENGISGGKLAREHGIVEDFKTIILSDESTYTRFQTKGFGRVWCEPSEELVLVACSGKDNAPVHTVKSARSFLASLNVEVPPWPAQIPDLNHMENIWSFIEIKIRQRDPPSNIAQLERWVKEEWDVILVNYYRNLIKSMPQRVQAVIAANGSQTKY
ncbi:124_t:CDS:2 [Ambispora gerdemannii]|uniref:124_t:CDS:1 n=1 Tax=Ambispora gerdemannii TaxID=144530 RepID=A0A9N8YTI0_9GLOM|nr:124_t:CDS:2 [Ambispora gerdemannii]